MKDQENWMEIEEILGFKQWCLCKYKWCTFQKKNVNYKWTEEEDKLLYQIISEIKGKIKWLYISQEMFIRSQGRFFRKGKLFRERWNNYLNPQMKRGFWTEEEDLQLLEYAIEEGLKWSNISKKLGNRTENNVKNRVKSLILRENKINKRQQSQEVNIDCKEQQIQLIKQIIRKIQQNLLRKTKQEVCIQQYPLPYQLYMQQYILQQQQQQMMYMQMMQQQQMILPNPHEQFQQNFQQDLIQNLKQDFKQDSDRSPIGSLSQFSEADAIKVEEEQSSSSSGQAKEPLVVKQVCFPQVPSQKSSCSNDSFQSMDNLKRQLQNLNLSKNPSENDQQSNNSENKYDFQQQQKKNILKAIGGSQRNLLLNGKHERKYSQKVKRSLFYYQQHEQE